MSFGTGIPSAFLLHADVLCHWTTRITLSGDWPIILVDYHSLGPQAQLVNTSKALVLTVTQKWERNIASNRVVSVAKADNTRFMQRLFPMFPRGGPGLGLLLLRISVAAIFTLNIANSFGLSSKFSWLIVAITLLISISICIGFLTPFVSVIAFVAAAVNLLLGAQTGNLFNIGILTAAAALIFLGPGAYSVDAKLFGLRVTVIPRKDTNRRAPQDR